MKFVLLILGALFVADIAWWIISARLTTNRSLRVFVSLFAIAQIAALAFLIASRFQHSAFTLPKFAATLLVVWHIIVIPVLLVAGMIALPILLARSVTRRFGRQPPVAAATRGVTRRAFVGTALAVTPPLLNISLGAIALRQLESFRVRRFTLPLANLPRAFDGLTVAQVSDIHVGRFTSGRVLREMVRITNELRADLVLLTGDLINDALSDVSEALDLARSMQAAHGVFLIEGNHDLIENPAEFEERARRSGIPFLLDATTTLEINGAALQLLGLSWTRAWENREAAIAESVRRLISKREPDAFPILLAHHPHAFDAAADAQIPLTLSGHTHGGQLMLSERVGFGPAMFRYWSGRYQRGASQLIVSNGVGNWFPLRIQAPAEIVHLTLRRA